jgi:hypothetical protein
MAVIPGPFKKHLASPALHKGTQVVKHQGKGARPFPPQPKPGGLMAGAPSPNDYAKQTPMPMPPPQPGGAPAPMDSMAGSDMGTV